MQPTTQTQSAPRLPYIALLAFFLPLGASAALVMLSHIIISGTLARAPHPEIAIAGYTIAMSVFALIEEPVVVLRQTATALAINRASFVVLGRMTLVLLAAILLIGLGIAVPPLGPWIFRRIFQAQPAMLPQILPAYRMLMFVAFFSAIRCVFQGLIIRHLQTKWLTIGMCVRVGTMYGLSVLYLHHPGAIAGSTGALLFLAGMFVEAVVSVGAGTRILKLPDVRNREPALDLNTQILPFYRPLAITAIILNLIGPAIQISLGRTSHLALAISSYSLAGNTTLFVLSFFSYIHQIVLNFVTTDATRVRRFVLMLWPLPSLLIATLSFTPIGAWYLHDLIGASGALLSESLKVLRIFLLMALANPWIEYNNGCLMHRRQTRLLIWSQSANMLVTVCFLILGVAIAPSLDGRIGAAAQSLGVATELLCVFLFVRMYRKEAGPSLGWHE